jgi:membrane-bound ClpP family serine protease
MRKFIGPILMLPFVIGMGIALVEMYHKQGWGPIIVILGIISFVCGLIFTMNYYLDN